MAEGKSPQQELMRLNPPRETAAQLCLLTLTHAPFSVVEEHQADGGVVYCVPAGTRWLPWVHRRIFDEVGVPLTRSADHRTLSRASLRSSSANAARLRRSGPAEAPGDAGDAGAHAANGASPSAEYTLYPCAERREAVLRFLDTELARFILTGPSTLPDVEGVNSVDLQVMAYLYTLNLPNASVGIVDGGGRLRHARGYTHCDWFVDSDDPYVACPSTLYRIASLTKPITAMAVQRLVAEGSLDRSGAPVTHETPFREMLSAGARALVPSEVEYWPGVDPATVLRWDIDAIRLIDLLTHQAGWCEADTACEDTLGWWDRSRGLYLNTHDLSIFTSFTPSSGEIHLPIDQQAYTEYAFSSQGFASYNRYKWVPPGERYAYSNFGYALLGRVLEGATGAADWTGWYDALKALVLDPLGMSATVLAHTAEGDRTIHESIYSANRDRFKPEPCVLSDFEYALSTLGGPDDTTGFVDQAYGGRVHIEALQAGGGLLSNVVDYCKFLTDQRLFDYNYDPATDDPTGRLWRALDWANTLELRRVQVPSVISRAVGWFLDESFDGQVLKSGGGVVGHGGGWTADNEPLDAAFHGGNWPGMNATAFLFPPRTSAVWSNLGIACMLNRDIATQGREAADPSPDAYVPTPLATLLATLVSSLSTLGETKDYFSRF